MYLHDGKSVFDPSEAKNVEIGPHQIPRPMASYFEESSACHVAAAGPVWLMFSSIL